MLRAFLVLLLAGFMVVDEALPQDVKMSRLPPVPTDNEPIDEGIRKHSLNPLKELLSSTVASQARAGQKAEIEAAGPSASPDTASPIPQPQNVHLPGSLPPTVQQFHLPETWIMQLGEAIHLALENNPEVAVQSFVPELAGTQVQQARSRFDPSFEANHHFSQSQSTLSSNVATFGTGSNTQRTGTYGQAAGRPDQLAISKTLRNGTAVRAGFSTGYSHISPSGSFNTLNPNWRSGTALEFTTPLKRGRGARINTMPIRIACAYQNTSINDLKSIVLQLVRDVENAFWNLSLSHYNLEVRRKNVVTARQTLEKEQQKFAIGESSRPAIGEAKLNFLNMVDLYNMRKTELLEDERAFRELIGLSGIDVRRIFVELPDQVPEIQIDWNESVATMMAVRPDLISQRFTEKVAKLQYELACNQCLPDLNFEGRFAKSGLDDRFDQSLQRMIKDDDFVWMLGFSYQRNVNRWGAKAESRRAFLNLQQQKAVTARSEFSATHKLQQAYEQLYLKSARIDQLKRLREAANERLEAYKEKFDLGELAIELYLRAQAADADAELKELSAKVEYLQSFAQFEFVRGTLLNIRRVTIAGKEPETKSNPDNDEGILLLPETTENPRRPEAPDFREMLRNAPDAVRDILLNDGTQEVDP